MVVYMNYLNSLMRWIEKMAYKITYSHKFKKNYRKFQSHEKKQVKDKVELLSKNPWHPSLRTKKIQGIKHLFECSVNMDIRIIWYYEEGQIIALLDVGHHDILNLL